MIHFIQLNNHLMPRILTKWGYWDTRLCQICHIPFYHNGVCYLIHVTYWVSNFLKFLSIFSHISFFVPEGVVICRDIGTNRFVPAFLFNYLSYYSIMKKLKSFIEITLCLGLAVPSFSVEDGSEKTLVQGTCFCDGTTRGKMYNQTELNENQWVEISKRYGL